MLKKGLHILNHRNFILSLSLILGFILGENTILLADYSVWILALVMVFATSGFAFSDWKPWTKTLGQITHAFFLNYILFGLLLIGSGYLFFSDEMMIAGLVLLALSPPGPSVVPFTAVMKGDLKYAVTGVFGLHLLSIVVTPFALMWLLGKSAISPEAVIIIMAKVIVGPLIISRFLRHSKIYPTVEKVRGHVINWGFFLVVMPIVGLSKGLILGNPEFLWLNILIFTVLMFGGGLLFNLISKLLKIDNGRTIAANLMFTTKSSAFAAVASFTLLPRETALPAAVHAIFVTLYFIVYDGLVKRNR
jgi:BASS family bile acid:Na+ symporter